MSTNGAREEIEKERLAAVEHLASLVHDPQVADRRRDQAATTLLSLSLGTFARREQTTNGHAAANGDGGGDLRDMIVNPTPREMELMEYVLGIVAQGVGRELRDISKRIAERDEQIAGLKKDIAECLKDAGVWDEKTTYPPGRLVTSDGSAWVSRQLNSHAKPGTSGVWRLLVSRGRNGRDAKGSR
jgi:hypothetical protein